MTDEQRRQAILSREDLSKILTLLKSHQLPDGMLTKDFAIANHATLLKLREHTIEISFRLREKALELYPNFTIGMPQFDREYEKLFRELDKIELEAMILAHEIEIHRRRPHTMSVIRDALMNKILVEEEMNDLPVGDITREIKEALSKTNLTIAELERVAIQNELERTNGNLSKAAENLGIGRSTMYRKVKEYGVTR